MNIFITGAGGFIGRSILVRLLKEPHYQNIYVLMRPNHKGSANDRVSELVQALVPPDLRPEVTKKIKTVSGDLTSPNLGISDNLYREVVSSTDQILHTAGLVELGAPIDELRKNNVDGTRQLLELANECRKKGRLKRFDYISTAYVGGINKEEAVESDLSRGQSFANNYEQSKYEAEQLVHQYKKNFPIAIYRPSIVIGDSRTGYTKSFNVMYWPLKLLASGIPRYIVPGFPKARLDIVPIDYVADSIVVLMQRKESLGKVFHLTAGRGNELVLDGIYKDAREIMHLKKYLIIPIWVFKFINKTHLKRLLPQKYWYYLRFGLPYSAYLQGGSVSFNSDRTVKELKGIGITVPDWESYKYNIFNYCIETKWGRKRKPEYEYYQAIWGTS